MREEGWKGKGSKRSGGRGTKRKEEGGTEKG
jgi:hypothetical protein